MKLQQLIGILLMLIFSCGIPSFDYIDSPELINSDTESLTFKIDLTKTPYISKFKIYSRYFIESDSKEDKFVDLTISDMPNGVERFLKDNGFSLVEFHDITDIYPSNQGYQEIDVVRNILFDIKKSGDNYLILTDNISTTYKLKSNYINYSHFIGNYTDEQGYAFLDYFNVNKIASIRIEFVIVNFGISSTLSNLESLPTYFNPIDLQVY